MAQQWRALRPAPVRETDPALVHRQYALLYSELKTAIICRELVKRYLQQIILSVVGLRRQESPLRALAPVYAPQPRLCNSTHETSGYSWHPILAWSAQEVLTYHQVHHLPLHEAYTPYGTKRVSCVFCILSSLHDLLQSATRPDNHDIYREMVELEMISTFSFQEGRWLGEIALHLLCGETVLWLKEAQQCAAQREGVQARIPYAPT